MGTSVPCRKFSDGLVFHMGSHQNRYSDEARSCGKIIPMGNRDTRALKSPAYFQKLLITRDGYVWREILLHFWM